MNEPARHPDTPHEEYTHIMNPIKRFGAILGIVAVLAAPMTAFAADANSDTAESLSVADTISMTAPASATYTLADVDGDPPLDFQYAVDITVIGSNATNGVTLKVKVDPWVGPGGITVPTTGRAALLIDYVGVSDDPGVDDSGAPLTRTASSIAAGQWANSTTSKNLATSTGPLANADLNVQFYVNSNLFTVGGTYTSAAHYTASTNP